MNDAQGIVEIAKSMLAAIVAGVVLPATLLAVLLGVAFWVIWLAQKRQDFDIADLLRSYHEPTQSWRVDPFMFCTLMGFAVHSAYFYATLWSSTPNVDVFFWYGVTWAGSPALIEMARSAKQWNGQLPFARGSQ